MQGFSWQAFLVGARAFFNNDNNSILFWIQSIRGNDGFCCLAARLLRPCASMTGSFAFPASLFNISACYYLKALRGGNAGEGLSLQKPPPRNKFLTLQSALFWFCSRLKTMRLFLPLCPGCSTQLRSAGSGWPLPGPCFPAEPGPPPQR